MQQSTDPQPAAARFGHVMHSEPDGSMDRPGYVLVTCSCDKYHPDAVRDGERPRAAWRLHASAAARKVLAAAVELGHVPWIVPVTPSRVPGFTVECSCYQLERVVPDEPTARLEWYTHAVAVVCLYGPRDGLSVGGGASS